MAACICYVNVMSFRSQFLPVLSNKGYFFRILLGQCTSKSSAVCRVSAVFVLKRLILRERSIMLAIELILFPLFLL